MGLLAWIVLGAIAGFIANMIYGGNEGVIGTVILGIWVRSSAGSSPAPCSRSPTSPA